MTDRELLELAAKAAGIEGLQFESDGTVQNRMTRPTIPYNCHGLISAIDWNPLKDDGDALRLAVGLGMMIDYIDRGFKAGHVVATAQGKVSAYEPRDPDPYAATRRAIVRAAAEIGEVNVSNRTWHKGPPPHVGWWEASDSRIAGFWRWWDGKQWSIGIMQNDSAKEVKAAAHIVDRFQELVEWTVYWPENARVPRIDPRGEA